MLTYNDILRKLREGEQFSFSRWGDGEWNAVLGRSGENCDGHKYFPDMGQRLKEVLESKPDYYLGMQLLALRLNQEDKEFQRLYQMNEWGDAEIIYNEVIGGGLDDLLDTIRCINYHNERDVIVVAPQHILDADIVSLSYACQEVNKKDAWLDYENVKLGLWGMIEGSEIILYCCGMMAGVLIDDFKHAGVTQIDIGSAFDPLCGVYSRSKYKQLHEQGKL